MGQSKSLNQYFASLKANLTKKVKVNVTVFLNNPRPLDDQFTDKSFKLKFLTVQKLSSSQGITQNF